jgi:hypothetical protein
MGTRSRNFVHGLRRGMKHAQPRLAESSCRIAVTAWRRDLEVDVSDPRRGTHRYEEHAMCVAGVLYGNSRAREPQSGV